MWNSAALCHVHLASPPPTTDLDLRLHTRCDGLERASSPGTEGRKEASEERRLHWHRGHYIGVTKWRSGRERKHHSFFGSLLLPSSSLGPLSSLSSNNACGGKKTIHSIIHVREAATAALFDLGQGLTRGGATFELSFAVLS